MPSKTLIPICRQDEPEPPFEHCCFCDKPTMDWTNLPDRTPGEQVACCGGCADKHQPSEVPTKKAWFDAEQKRHPKLVSRPWH